MSDSIPTDRAELEQDIRDTRARLASTADALAAKADVKAQATAKVEDVKAKVHEVSAGAPGSGTQQSGVLIAGIVLVTALAVWLVVRKR